MTDLGKAGSGSVWPEIFNAVVDALRGHEGRQITAAAIDSQAAQDGDVLTADGSGGAAWEAGGGSQPLEGAGPPTQGANTIWSLGPTSAPLGSGTYKLTFEGVTTVAIAFDAEMLTVANEMNAAYGESVVSAYPGSEQAVITAFSQSMLFIGALGAQVVATPTVTDDTTDTGVTTADDTPGSAPAPIGTPGQLYRDTDSGALYQFGLITATGTAVNSWYPVAPAAQLISPDGLTQISLLGNHIVMRDTRGHGTWNWSITGDDGNDVSITAVDDYLYLQHYAPNGDVGIVALQSGRVSIGSGSGQREILNGTVDPSAASGIAAAIGALYSKTDDGTQWSKTGATDTDWQQLAFVAP